MRQHIKINKELKVSAGRMTTFSIVSCFWCENVKQSNDEPELFYERLIKQYKWKITAKYGWICPTCCKENLDLL